MHGPATTSRTTPPGTASTHHATTHSSTKHTACLTRLRRSIRPARPSRTSCAVAACAKSRVSVGAMRPQHPEITGKSAKWPSKGPQHLLCPLSCHLPVTGDQQARPALPPERAARPNTRQSARKPRTDGAARPDPKRQLPLAEVHVAFTPHSDFWDGVNSRDACMHGHDSSYLTRSGWHRPSPDARKSSNELSSISHRVAIE